MVQNDNFVKKIPQLEVFKGLWINLIKSQRRPSKDHLGTNLNLSQR